MWSNKITFNYENHSYGNQTTPNIIWKLATDPFALLKSYWFLRIEDDSRTNTRIRKISRETRRQFSKTIRSERPYNRRGRSDMVD